MKKVFIFIGTRPEAIKLAPLIHVIRKNTNIELKVISTGQHREMLDQVFNEFDIHPDFNLGVMSRSQTLADLTSILFREVGNLLFKSRPDMVVVQGDTTTAMSVATCAFYEGIPIAHVEAGLRSGDIFAPFPEEVNRRFISTVAGLHFAPTQYAANHLISEGINLSDIHIPGNTAIDAVLWMRDKLQISPPVLPKKIEDIIRGKCQFILITGHRRESFGEGFDSICEAINALSIKHPDTYFVYPLHLNPKVREPVFKSIGNLTNVVLTEPLNYSQFIYVMSHAYFVLTDSGGVQEEAPALNKPVLVMRKITERQEGIAAGCANLVGVEKSAIIDGVSQLMSDKHIYNSMANAINPYGDGLAAHKICSAILDFWKRSKG